MGGMRKLVAGAVVAGALVTGIGVGTASAAAPTVHGCFGGSISANAQALHPYGQLVLDPAAPRNFYGTIGDAVHAIQGGQVPDDLFPNTCN